MNKATDSPGKRQNTKRLSGPSKGQTSKALTTQPDVAHFEPPAGLDAMSLQQLAGKINTGLATIESEAFNARRYATAALHAAIHVGHFLAASRKKCSKGQWGAWRDRHLPGLSQATAYRYISLAKKFSHVGNHVAVQTLRQAYIAVGILPEASKEAKRVPALTGAPVFNLADLLATVRTAREFLQSVGSLDLGKLDPELRAQIGNELSELLAVAQRLRDALARQKSMKPAQVVEISSTTKKRP
jgi:hypothetical protein